MKKFLLSLIVLALILGASGAVYLRGVYPRDLPAARVDFRVDLTPERLARGKYLAHHVTVCIDCHSKRDWTLLSGPIVPGTEGGGGEVFDASVGVPGRLVSPNITPFALLNWRDDEILRAFTVGVSASGRVLFPLMPYPDYRNLTESDALALVAYIRTLAPVEVRQEVSRVSFPMSLIMRTIPKPAEFQKEFSGPVDTVAVGKYLAQVAGCMECHTQSKHGTRLAGMDFGGGREFKGPAGIVRSTNITPDPATGIGAWTRADFVRKFKSFSPHPVEPKEPNTPMPWSMYQGMTEADLGSIYDYLRKVAPLRNAVERFSPLTTVTP